MKVTKRQLRRIIKEEKRKILLEQQHQLDVEVLEIEHHYGKSDAYSYLYDALQKVGDEEALEALEEFEMLEQYGFDVEELLDTISQWPGLKDRVLPHL